MAKSRAFLVPGFTNGALTENEYIQGGIFNKLNRTQRNNIPFLRRSYDSTTTTLCYVSSENTWFKLINNPSSNTTSDADWELMDFGATKSLVPIGVWDAVANTPALTDSGAAGINGSFYYVTNAPVGVTVTNPLLFGGVTKTVYNNDLVISIGSSWTVIRPTSSWDSIAKPAVIDAYVAGTVIAHTHAISDVTGLVTALDLKFDASDVADSGIPFGSVPLSAIVDVEFLTTHYYTAAQVNALITGAVSSGSGINVVSNAVNWGGQLTQNVVITNVSTFDVSIGNNTNNPKNILITSDTTTTIGSANTVKLAFSSATNRATMTGALVIAASTSTLRFNNPANNFAYVIGTSAIVADRTVSFPLLTANDTFVTAAFQQTLTNKTLGTGTNIVLGSDAIGDIYYRAIGALGRLGIGAAHSLIGSNGLTGGSAAPEYKVVSNGLTSTTGSLTLGGNFTSNIVFIKTGGGNPGFYISNAYDFTVITTNSIGLVGNNGITLSSNVGGSQINLYSAGEIQIIAGNAGVGGSVFIATDLAKPDTIVFEASAGYWFVHGTGSNSYYKMLTSNITSHRNITLPLLTANDTFVFANFIQTLNNKTLIAPKFETTSIVGYVWTATNTSGSGAWSAPSGGGSSLPAYPTFDGRSYFLSELDGTPSWTLVINANGTAIGNKNKLQAGAASDWNSSGHYDGVTSTATSGTLAGEIFYGTDVISGLKYRYEAITNDNWYRTAVNYGGGGGSGTVTTVSVVTANGFAGSVATPGSTPAITLSTSITGLMAGNGTALIAAVSNTHIKTVNGTTLIGSGDVGVGVTTVSVVTANGFAGSVATAGTTPAITISTTVAANEFVVSNGTGFVSRKIFSSVNGDIILGDTSVATTERTITPAGSNTDISIVAAVKGNGQLIIGSSTTAASGNNRILMVDGTNTNISLAFFVKGPNSSINFANSFTVNTNSYTGPQSFAALSRAIMGMEGREEDTATFRLSTYGGGAVVFRAMKIHGGDAATTGATDHGGHVILQGGDPNANIGSSANGGSIFFIGGDPFSVGGSGAFGNYAFGTISTTEWYTGQKVIFISNAAVEPTAITSVNGALIWTYQNIFKTNAFGLKSKTSTANETMDTSAAMWIFTGTVDRIWTLPSLATTREIMYFIKNRGTAKITLTRAGADNIVYGNTNLTTFDINPGEAYILSNDLAVWILM